MATVPNVTVDVRKGVYKTTWEALANGDDGGWLDAPHLTDKSVQVLGTFGVNGSVDIEGSNDGGTTQFKLTNPSDTDLTFTATGGEAILQNVQLIRPKVTNGDGTTAIDVVIVSKG